MQPTEDLSPLDRARQVDAVCDRFEAQWRAGPRPCLEDFLSPLPASLRAAALRGLLAVEIELRGAGGECPSVGDYLDRFPEHADFILEVVGSSAETSVCRPGDRSTGPLPGAANGRPSAGEAPPARIGRFEVRAVLGEGAFGTVYLARDPRLDRDVAVKVPRPAVLGPDFDAGRFLREARAAAVIHHPNVCPIYEVDVEAGRPYIVMEFIAGQTLADFLKGGKSLPPRQAALLVRRLALALQAAHDRGVVHRDLKPGNVLIHRERGDVVLTDFGMARVAGRPEAEQTQSGVILGTPTYMAPEQARGDGRAVGPRSDVYSLGVILYELLAGRRPFTGTVGEVIGQVIHVEPEPPSRLRPGMDLRLEAICLRAMAKDPAARYASMRAMAEALNGYLGDAPAEADARQFQQMIEAFAACGTETWIAVEQSPRKPRVRLRRWLAAAGLVAAILLSVGIAWRVWPHPGSNAVLDDTGGPRTAARREPEGEWAPLCNGQDLTGWWAALGKISRWRVENGDLVADAQGGQTILLNDWRLHDFAVRLEFRFDDVGGDGGLLLYAPSGASLEVDLLEESQVPDEQRAVGKTTGNLFWLPNGGKRVERLAPAAKAGQWNRLEVQLVEGELTVAVNGETVLTATADELAPLREDLTSPTPRGLAVGLQSFGKTARYRNIEFRGRQTNPPPPWPFAPDVPAPLTHYSFDEPYGPPFRDVRRRAAPALPNTTVRTVAGVRGRAVEFVGQRDGFLRVPSHPTMHGLAAFTAAVWVNGGPGKVLGRWSGRDLSFRLTVIEQTLVAEFHVPGRGGVPLAVRGPCPAGAWMHVAAVYDTRTVRLFLAGRLAAEAPVRPPGLAPVPFAEVDAPLRIGVSFTGQIDEVMLFDAALTADQIARLADGKR